MLLSVSKQLFLEAGTEKRNRGLRVLLAVGFHFIKAHLSSHKVWLKLQPYFRGSLLGTDPDKKSIVAVIR